MLHCMTSPHAASPQPSGEHTTPVGLLQPGVAVMSVAQTPVVQPGSAQNPPGPAVVVTGMLDVETQPEIRSGAIAEATTALKLRRLVFVIRTANMIPSLEN